MSALSDLEDAYENYCGILKRLTQDARENPQGRPTYSVDGKSISWTEYQGMVIDKLVTLRKEIAAASGPYMYRTRARP